MVPRSPREPNGCRHKVLLGAPTRLTLRESDTAQVASSGGADDRPSQPPPPHCRGCCRRDIRRSPNRSPPLECESHPDHRRVHSRPVAACAACARGASSPPDHPRGARRAPRDPGRRTAEATATSSSGDASTSTSGRPARTATSTSTSDPRQARTNASVGRQEAPSSGCISVARAVAAARVLRASPPRRAPPRSPRRR